MQLQIRKQILMGKSRMFLLNEQCIWFMDMRKVLDLINNQEKLQTAYMGIHHANQFL